MRVHVKLAKPVSTMNGSYAEFTGELDALGICWLDEQQKGRRVPPGMGVKIQEGSTVRRLDVPAQAAKEPAPKGKPAA